MLRNCFLYVWWISSIYLQASQDEAVTKTKSSSARETRHIAHLNPIGQSLYIIPKGAYLESFQSPYLLT